MGNFLKFCFWFGLNLVCFAFCNKEFTFSLFSFQFFSHFIERNFVGLFNIFGELNVRSSVYPFASASVHLEKFNVYIDNNLFIYGNERRNGKKKQRRHCHWTVNQILENKMNDQNKAQNEMTTKTTMRNTKNILNTIYSLKHTWTIHSKTIRYCWVCSNKFSGKQMKQYKICNITKHHQTLKIWMLEHHWLIQQSNKAANKRQYYFTRISIEYPQSFTSHHTHFHIRFFQITEHWTPNTIFTFRISNIWIWKLWIFLFFKTELMRKIRYSWSLLVLKI